ncbi:Tic22-like [Sesbania bispinosa]|nr:Tic22-like [Sesbania bispinosa]
MESQGQWNPLLSFSRFVHQHCVHLATRLEDTKRLAGTLVQAHANPLLALTRPKHALAATLSSQHVAKSLVGTSLYTVSNSNNEFVLISDADGSKSIGLLCFRQEDAEAFLAQVRSRKRELRGNARVVPITLDQVYMLKVEGIAFRFLPDPIQIKNALELRPASKEGFDGVPVFQSDLLVVKKKNKRYCPVYFSKEDIEQELGKISRASRGPGVSQHIMV